MDKKYYEVPEELREQLQEILGLETSLYDLEQSLKNKTSLFWTRVEQILDARGKILKYDKISKKIEVIDNTKEKDEEALKGILSGKFPPLASHEVSMSTKKGGSALPRIRARGSSLLEKLGIKF